MKRINQATVVGDFTKLLEPSRMGADQSAALSLRREDLGKHDRESSHVPCLCGSNKARIILSDRKLDYTGDKVLLHHTCTLVEVVSTGEEQISDRMTLNTV